MSNPSPSPLPWIIAVVATAIGAGALGFFAGMGFSTGAAPAPAAPTAQQAPADPNQLPPGATTEAIGDWILYCQEANGQNVCSATQDIKNASNQVILSVIAGYDEAAQKAMLVRTPLGIDLGAGLEFNLPGDKPVAFQFTACDQMSCNAILSIPEANYPKLDAAGSFDLAYTRADGVRVPVKVSMKGLTDAFTKIIKPTPAAPAAAPAAAAPAEGTAPATPAPAAPATPEPTTPAPPPAQPTPAPDGIPQPTPKPAQP